MSCAVDYIFNLLCAFNFLQPIKKFVFSVASRATGWLQIKPSGSGDENDSSMKGSPITAPNEDDTCVTSAAEETVQFDDDTLRGEKNTLCLL